MKASATRCARDWIGLCKSAVLGASLLGSTAYLSPVFAQGNQIARWTVGAWNGALIEDNDGFFERCVAAVEFQNGMTLSVSLDSAARLEVRFTDDRWNLDEPRSYFVQMEIDGVIVVPRTTGRPTRRSQLLTSPGNNFTLLGQLRRGRQLHLVSDFGPLDDARFSLQDSSAALLRMAQCFPGAVPRQNSVGRADKATVMVAMRPEANLRVLGEAVDTIDGEAAGGVAVPNPNPPD